MSLPLERGGLAPLFGDPRERVLGALRFSGPMARVELAAATHLSPATVTAVTADLLAEGLIETGAPDEEETDGEAAARRGRPRVQLRLRGDAAYVAGVKISMHRISVSISNFVGDVLGARSVSVRASRQPPDTIAALIEGALRETVAELGVGMDRITGVGVALPGFVEAETGVIHWSPVFGDQKVGFGALMTRRLARPTLVDNDSNLATLAQHWFGPSRGAQNVVVVTIEHGVGMGVVIGGQLYRGARGFGAEFGHTKIQRGGALCRCGQRGCIEAYLADYALLREASTFFPVRDQSDPVEAHRALAEVVAAGRAGDDRIRAIYARAGEILGVGIANLINILGPDHVVVTGEGAGAADLFEDAMRAALAANTLSASADVTPVRVTPGSDEVWAHGAAALVLQRHALAPTEPAARSAS